MPTPSRAASLAGIFAAVSLIAGSVAFMAWYSRTRPIGRMDIAVAKARLARMSKESHDEAMATLAAFHKRTWNPARDAKIQTAEIAISVTEDGKNAHYRARFDGSKKLNDQVAFEAIDEDPGMDARLAQRMRRLAITAFLGPYQFVIRELPPIELTFVRIGGAPTINVPPFRSETSTTYQFAPTGEVVRRGTIGATIRGSDRLSRGVDEFTWRTWGQGICLNRAIEADGWDTKFDYDPAVTEFPAMTRATRTSKNAAAGLAGRESTAKLVWSNIVKR